jgi:hypothetical protein
MLSELIVALVIGYFHLMTVEMGEIAFFLVLIILTLAVIIKLVKNKKKARNSNL